MKIDSDLRAAIRSAEKSQPDIDWQRRSALNRDAAKELVEKGRHATRFANAVVMMKKAEELNRQANLVFDSIGVNDEFRIINEDAFAKAGGKYPMPMKRWKYDHAIAELAKANPKEAKAILKKYGILWE